MPTVQLTLVGKPGCHLCDDAREVISSVVSAIDSLPDAPLVTVGEVSILDDSELFDKYVEEIPVVLIDGVVHTYWRVDPARLEKALLGSATKEQ
jgi:predicted thioredoxin/glutaredoxin